MKFGMPKVDLRVGPIACRRGQPGGARGGAVGLISFRGVMGLIALVGLTGLGGCSTTHVPEVVPPLRCNIPAALLKECAAPAGLKEGLTFGELLSAHQADRQALRSCALQHADLRAAVETCRSETERHNADLERINAAAQAAAARR